MSSVSRTSNIIIGVLFLVGVAATVVFYVVEESGLAAFGAFVFTFCTMIVWIIQAVIDHNAAKKPARMLTAAELKRHRIMRLLVAIGLVAFLLSPLLFGH